MDASVLHTHTHTYTFTGITASVQLNNKMDCSRSPHFLHSQIHLPAPSLPFPALSSLIHSLSGLKLKPSLFPTSLSNRAKLHILQLLHHRGPLSECQACGWYWTKLTRSCSYWNGFVFTNESGIQNRSKIMDVISLEYLLQCSCNWEASYSRIQGNWRPIVIKRPIVCDLHYWFPKTTCFA